MQTGIKVIIFVPVLSIISCTTKFDKQKWQVSDNGFTPPYRNAMLKDLIENYKLKGLTTQQLKYLLGDSGVENNKIYYPIIIDYGTDIDPVYTKTLVFNFSKDSIITSYKIIEWGEK